MKKSDALRVSRGARSVQPEHSHPAFGPVLLPRTQFLSDAGLVVLASALIALSAQIAIPLPFTPVPITGQTFAVLLIGALLGSKRGAAAMLTYLIEGGLGLPVFAGGTGGFAILSGPRGGYLIGFVAAAFVVGYLAERGWLRRFPAAIVALILGNVTIYIFGLPWLAGFVGFHSVTALGLVPFIPGDLIKAVVAAVAVTGFWKLKRRENRDSVD